MCLVAHATPTFFFWCELSPKCEKIIFCFNASSFLKKVSKLQEMFFEKLSPHLDFNVFFVAFLKLVFLLFKQIF
jgi:hypothetical protein